MLRFCFKLLCFRFYKKNAKEVFELRVTIFSNPSRMHYSILRRFFKKLAWTYKFLIRTSHKLSSKQGWEFAFWIFVWIARFLEQKSKSLLLLFLNEQWQRFPLLHRAKRAMKSDLLFRFGHKKIEKQGERNKLEVFSSTPTLKKSESLFRLRSFALYLLSVGSKPLLSLFLKKWQEQKSERANSQPCLYCNYQYFKMFLNNFAQVTIYGMV